MLKEFKKFALKGNMIDLAVGIIIGGAFSGIVNSLVNDIVMPLLSLLTKNVNFTNWFLALDGGSYETLAKAQEAKAPTLNYGVFLSGVINFLIMSFVVFLMVRWINKLKVKGTEPAPVPVTKQCPYCMSEVHRKASKCPCCGSELENQEN